VSGGPAAREAGSIPQEMDAWIVQDPGPMAGRPLRKVRRAVPEPAAHELLVRVEACGVCRTDLHLAEGDLKPRRPQCTPGHEIVGRIVATGAQVAGFALDERVGIAWLAWTCGVCEYCERGNENLCPRSRYTGWDLDGGYAPYAVADAHYVYRLPSEPPAEELAPLLCAGIIGYRALKRAELPPGGRLGIYGFGASAHLTAQLAVNAGATVHVLTRSAEARQLALDLGAASAAGAYDAPPEPLDAAILFAPVGDLVPVALAALDHEKHVFQERTLRSVTANTREDGRELFAAVETARPRIAVTRYCMARADQALADLAADRVTGVAVLVD
jgi:alcohol dehydrogenase, propanol-preferring